MFQEQAARIAQEVWILSAKGIETFDGPLPPSLRNEKHEKCGYRFVILAGLAKGRGDAFETRRHAIGSRQCRQGVEVPPGDLDMGPVIELLRVNSCSLEITQQ